MLLTQIDYNIHFGYSVENKYLPYDDNGIVCNLLIRLSEYQNYLVEECNGKVKSSGVWSRTYFENKKDAEKAMEWIESLVFAREMKRKCQ